MAAKSKGNTQAMDLFDAHNAIDGLSDLFRNIKVLVGHSMENRDEETYRTAIEAVAEMGISECDEAVRRIQEARHAG